MRLNLAFPDGLQTNLTPLHPNRSTAQQTVRSVIVQDDRRINVTNSVMLSSTARLTPPTGGRDTKAKDSPSSEMEAEGGAGRGGYKTATQLRGGREAQGVMTGSAEGCRAEAGESDEEAAGSGRHGAGEDGAAGRDDPHTTNKGAAKAEIAGAN